MGPDDVQRGAHGHELAGGERSGGDEAPSFPVGVALDRARILADMGRIIDVVRTFIPSEQWPDVLAALRGETPAAQQSSQAVDGVRMVDIDDPRTKTTTDDHRMTRLSRGRY